MTYAEAMRRLPLINQTCVFLELVDVADVLKDAGLKCLQVLCQRP